jgi:hypothetical protein
MSGMPDHVTLARTLSGGLKHFDDGGVPFIRRDPAVLAALPEVKAMLAEAVAWERERCISRVRDNWVAGAKTTLGEVLAAIRAGGGQ